MSHLLRTGLLAIAVAHSMLQAQAAPFIFHYQLTVGDNGSGTPHPIFTGAQLDVTISLDTSNLVPVADGPGTTSFHWKTEWGSPASVATIKLTGTAAHDGVYPANIFNVFPWVMLDDYYIGQSDAIVFPPISIQTGGGEIGLAALRVHLPNTYFQPGESTLYPVPFRRSDALWSDPTIWTSNPLMNCAVDGEITGVGVPEPTTIVTSVGASAALLPLRRRK